MEAAVFEKFREIIYQRAGISLSRSKESLVSARIRKRMRALGMEKHSDYLQYVLNDQSGAEGIRLLDAISTNVTSFFREPRHFDFLRDVFAQWRADGQSRFRLWCAASSTGEEPLSMAMTLLDTGNASGADIRILATDISIQVLEHCQEGVYSHSKVATVPRAPRARYFQKSGSNGTRQYRVAKAVRDLVVYKRLNLSRPPFPMSGPLDVVFCRNVMIYFDDRVREGLLAEIYRMLRPGGYLMVGHAESLSRLRTNLKMVKPSIYRKD